MKDFRKEITEYQRKNGLTLEKAIQAVMYLNKQSYTPDDEKELGKYLVNLVKADMSPKLEPKKSTKPKTLNEAINDYANAIVKNSGGKISYVKALDMIDETKYLYREKVDTDVEKKGVLDREAYILKRAKELVDQNKANSLGDAISKLPKEITKLYR